MFFLSGHMNFIIRMSGNNWLHFSETHFASDGNLLWSKEFPSDTRDFSLVQVALPSIDEVF